MKIYCIIVAGGRGLRMGKEIPKQFIKVNGLPILMHTISRFTAYSDQIDIIVGLPSDQFDYWKSLCKKYNFTSRHILVEGGLSRFHTVKNCLQAIKNEGIVAVHDAVRPCVSLDTIKNCFNIAGQEGNAIPVIPVNDTLRLVSENKNVPVNRENYKIVQTPQVFKSEILKEAYHAACDDEFTDDASVVEKAGYTINLVEGNSENIKITLPSDLLVAAGFLSKRLL